MPLRRNANKNNDSKLYIGNLGKDPPCHEDLKYEFSYYGPILDVWIAKQPPGFAYVTFEDKRDAEDAMDGLNGARFKGRELLVKMANPLREDGRKKFDRPYGESRSRSRSRSRPRQRSRSRTRQRSRRTDRSRSKSRDRSRRSRKSRSISRSPIKEKYDSGKGRIDEYGYSPRYDGRKERRDDKYGYSPRYDGMRDRRASLRERSRSRGRY